jgi:hypothetical protein
MGLGGRQVFVPHSYALGQEAQVDWFEASAKLGGERCVPQFFAMRSMGSGDAFHLDLFGKSLQTDEKARIHGRCRAGEICQHENCGANRFEVHFISPSFDLDAASECPA